MATNYWRPRAARTIQRSVYAINTNAIQLRATINGHVLTATAGGNRDAAIDNMVSAWNAQQSPYFSTITASADAGTATQLILTADTPGVPFIVLIEEENTGWSTVSAAATSTAATGPEFYDNVLNWSEGAVPVEDDDVVFEYCATSCCWNLPAAAPAVGTFTIRQSFSGVLGLNPKAFATSADGRTVNTGAREYRQTTWAGDIKTILSIGAGDGLGSGRIRIKQNVDASDPHLTNIYIYNSGGAALDSGSKAIYLDAGGGSNTDCYVMNCPGGLYGNLNVDALNIAPSSASSSIELGETTVFVNLRVYSGIVALTDCDFTSTQIAYFYGGQTDLDCPMSGGIYVLIDGGRLNVNNQSFAPTRLQFQNGGGILDLSSVTIAISATDLYFLACPSSYQIVSPNTGVFATISGVTIIGDIDWLFEVVR